MTKFKKFSTFKCQISTRVSSSIGKGEIKREKAYAECV